MKKVLLVLIPLLALIGGYYFYSESQKKPSRSILDHSESKVLAPEVRQESLLGKVRADSIGVFHFSKQKFQPLINRVAAYGDKIQSSAVWKKMNFDKTVEKSVTDQLEQQIPSEVATTVGKGEENIDFLKSLWTALSEVTVVMSPEKFQLQSDISIPKAMLEVHFQGPELAKKILEKARKALDTSPSPGSEPFTFSQDTDEKNLYHIWLNIAAKGSPPEKVKFAAARFKQAGISYYLGATDDKDFTSDMVEKTLVSSEDWKKMIPLMGSQASVLFFGKLTLMLRSLLEALEKSTQSESDRQELKKFIDLIKASESKSAGMITVGGLDVSDRVVQRFCFAQGKATDNSSQVRFKELFAKENQLSPSSPALRLLSDKTILSVVLSTGSIRSLVDPAMEQHSFEFMSEYSLNAGELGESARLFDALKEIVNSGLQDVGFFLNTGLIPTSPDVFLYLSTEPNKTDSVMESMKAQFDKLGPPEGMDFRVEDLVDGGKKYVLALSGSGIPFQLSGSQVDDSTILFASNEMGFGSGSQLLLSENSYLNSEPGKKLAQEIDGKSYFFLMSTRPVLQLASMFQGFIQAELDKKGIRSEDVDELKALLSFDYINTQSLSSPENGISCTESRSLMME